MTARPIVVLLSVLCLSTADAFAQDEHDRMAQVICAGNQECLTLARHRLSAERLRTMFAVDREVMALMKEVPDLQTRMDELAMRLDPQRRLGKVTLAARVHEGTPEIAQILRKHKTTGQEYMLTLAVAAVAAMSDVSLARGVASEDLTPAQTFWRSMDPALRAEADAWKKMRGYDAGLNR